MRSYIIHMTGDINRQSNAKTLLSTLPGARIVDAVVGSVVGRDTATKPRPGNLFRPRRLLDRSGMARLYAPHLPGLQTLCQVVGRMAVQRVTPP
ncbi:MAG: hypothetical protein AB8B51_06505 [Sedimentitalea sp.]